ncbi:MAG: YncE family protein [Thaumarchaeota archaeon]|nr:YncE family protein [Nitrososphaerota archaeon]MDG6905485.1 YncE family protein [Nitrososphaerota archaeon]
MLPIVIIVMGAALTPYAMRVSSLTTYSVSYVNVGSQPQGVVYDSGKGEIFVSNYGDNTVSVINETTHAVIKTISVDYTPGMMAYDSTKGEIYVVTVNPSILDPYGYIKVISDSTNTVVATIKLPWPLGMPSGIAYDWGKGTIYVAISTYNVTAVISDTTNTIIDNVTGLSRPGAVLYDQHYNSVFIGNTAPKNNYYTISVVNDAINDVVATINLGTAASYAQPGDMTYDPAKGEIFVTELYTGNVTVISDANYAILANVHVGGDPYGPIGVAYDSGHGQVWLSDVQFVYALSDATNTMVANVTGFGMPAGLAYASHSGDVYVADYALNRVGIIHPTEVTTTGNTVTTTVTATATTTVTSRITTTVTTTSIPPPVTTTVTSTHMSTTTQTNTVTNTATVTETSVSTTASTVTETTPVTTTVTTTSVPPPVTTTETSTLTLPQETTTVTSTSISTTTETSTSTSTSTSTQTVGSASITLNCAPATVTLGRNVRCNAVATAGYPPAGNISFSNTPGSGTFGTQTCTVRANTLTCTVAYTPSVGGPQQVNATYSNDPNFLTVQASSTINVKSSAAYVLPIGSVAPLSQSSIIAISAGGIVIGISVLLGAQRLRFSGRHSRNSDNKARPTREL